MTGTAFLSVRVPDETRRRVKELAARRGATVQQVVREAVERLLAAETPPVLTDVLGRLRSHAGEFRERGVTAMWVFGSVARGDAGPDSDIDLVVDIDPRVSFSLVDLASLKARAEDILGRRVDLGERRSLKTEFAADVEREAVGVF